MKTVFFVISILNSLMAGTLALGQCFDSATYYMVAAICFLMFSREFQ